MAARIVLLASLVLLVAAPPAEVAEAAPDVLVLVLVEEGATPLADDLAVAPYAAGAAGRPAGAARPIFAGEAIPPGPPLARVFRPPRSSLR